MLNISLQSDIEQLAKSFDSLGDAQVSYATSVAMNRAAKPALEALRAALALTFDRPTPYTMNSLYIKYSSKSDLSVRIGHKDIPDGQSGLPASAYLKAEIEGGERAEKSTEKLVGEYIVPARATKLDAYGNIPAATMGIVRQAIQQGQVELNGKTYVTVKAGNRQGLAPGVYLRVNQKVKIRGRAGNKTAEQVGGSFIPVVFFEPQEHYSKRYDMETPVWSTFQAEFERQFVVAMDQALSSAKVRITP